MFSRIGPAVALLVALGPASVALAQAGRASGPGDGPSATASTAAVRVTGTVRDEQNAIPLPGLPVEVVGTSRVVYTDVDGRYLLDLTPGTYELRVAMDGYQERTIRIVAEGRSTIVADVGLSMTRYAEEVTVVADLLEAATSTAAAQLIERKRASVITDNLASQEMKANGDSDAATAMQRVTGLSVVDGQYVFVRGLGERYSNTTLAGSIVPTTEPDKKVVPLDLFPAGLLDSVQVAKTYSPDKPAEFAGGLVQVVPAKLPSQPVLDLSYGLGVNSQATGKDIILSPLGKRDWLGFDAGAREFPSGFPEQKLVRRGIYTPDVGFAREDIDRFGRVLENRWLPVSQSGRPHQSWSVSYGNRFGKLGVLASMTHSYKESFVREDQRFFRVDEEGLEAVSDYDIQYGHQKAQLGVVANVAYQFTPNHRLSFENFYVHTGKDEGRLFEGPNTENNFLYRNNRLSFVEEGLLTNAVSGDHFFQGWGNSRIDWRASYGQATRNEPDLRETLYIAPLGGGTFRLADESQSGFRLFMDLEDDTQDLALNWSTFGTINGRPIQFKFGPSYTRRTRDFTSRRFRYIPTNIVNPDFTLPPEQLFTQQLIGPAFRFNEETRPVDAYDAEQTNLAFYGMGDFVLSNRARLVAGARVERFDQAVNTFDPFGLFVERVEARLENTDIFPGVNLVYSLRPDMNLRVGYSQTVNRPEFRELAAFEFTDIVGQRATRGNPNLTRALIQNFDARWEMFGDGRGVVAASAFYKKFNDPIERVIIASAQPISTFQNADSARNLGFELEASRQVGRNLYFSLNYTYVDSEITLTDEARRTQTSLVRPLAGQSNNLFNAIGEVTAGSFQARLLFNFFDERISDVGASGAPDIIEEGRGTVDLVVSQRWKQLLFRVTFDNLTNSQYRFTQGDEDQRLFKLGRTVLFSVGYSFF